MYVGLAQLLVLWTTSYREKLRISARTSLNGRSAGWATAQAARALDRGYRGGKKVVVADSGFRVVVDGDELEFFWSNLEHCAFYLHPVLI